MVKVSQRITRLARLFRTSINPPKNQEDIINARLAVAYEDGIRFERLRILRLAPFHGPDSPITEWKRRILKDISLREEMHVLNALSGLAEETDNPQAISPGNSP